MKFYHGTHTENLTIQPHVNSRYGFAAFFATPNKNLAIKYAYASFKKQGTGHLYSLLLDEDLHTVDFKRRISHASSFRNLIHQLKNEQHPAVFIKNVIDYPNKELAEYSVSTILVIFDLDLIPTLKLIGSY